MAESSNVTAPFRFSPRPNRTHEIDWREWGESAFAQAKSEGKPILLGISAVWCHWCHVMDETSYSDPAIIQTINERFIPIRVDNDKRPDVNLRYNQGGWPTTALLTPEGELLAGATYVPPGQLLGWLRHVADYYARNRDEISRQVESFQEAHDHEHEHLIEEEEAGPATLSAKVVNTVVASIKEAYDPAFGGLGVEPKFPHTDAFLLLAELAQQTGDNTPRTMLTTTLDRMAGGGMYDHEAGGFFRYSTTRDWSIPHFEKMLEDHAGLITLYARAWQITGEAKYKHILDKTVGYLDATLRDPERGFFQGSQDADEEYYHLNLAQRAKLPAPYVDPICYVNWNGQMISGYLELHRASGEPAHLATALAALTFLWEHCYSPEVGMYHYYDTAPHVTGLLTDQVSVLAALIAAAEATGDPLWRDRALELWRTGLERCRRPNGDTYQDRAAGSADLGRVTGGLTSPVENAQVAECARRLTILTGDESFAEHGRRMLDLFAGQTQHLTYFGAGYALAASRYLRDPLHVTIVGEPTEAATQSLIDAAATLGDFATVINVLSPTHDAARIEAEGYLAAGHQPPVAFACAGLACSAPVTDAAGLAQAAAGLRR